MILLHGVFPSCKAVTSSILLAQVANPPLQTFSIFTRVLSTLIRKSGEKSNRKSGENFAEESVMQIPRYIKEFMFEFWKDSDFSIWLRNYVPLTSHLSNDVSFSISIRPPHTHSPYCSCCWQNNLPYI